MKTKFKSFLNEATDDVMDVYSTATSEEDLTSYYKCNDCGNNFYVFNQQYNGCKNCNSNNIQQISDFEFFSNIKMNKDSKVFADEMSKKRKREAGILNLNDLDRYEKMRNYRKNIN